jgi:hypothetical protein
VVRKKQRGKERHTYLTYLVCPSRVSFKHADLKSVRRKKCFGSGDGEEVEGTLIEEICQGASG